MTACGGGEEWDGVAVVTYTERALGQHVKRRIRLLSTGVELRGDLAPDTAWTDALGYTFIGRRPEPYETGVRGVRAMRVGVRVRDRVRGFSRTGPAVYRLGDGYRLVDVFDPTDRYVATAAARQSMSGRCILLHLGATRRQGERCDRLFLTPEHVRYWRDLLPVVLRNRGYGYLYQRLGRRRDRQAAGDSTEILAERFDLEEVGEHILVGKTRRDQRYRHVFTDGGEYLVTAIQHGDPYLEGPELLALLGLSATRSAAGE